MPIIAKLDWVNATDTAVPIKGAEHGVAINVAKKPLKKSRTLKLDPIFLWLKNNNPFRYGFLGRWLR